MDNCKLLFLRLLIFQGWKKIRSELTKKDLAEILKQLRTLALGAATQSPAMKNAVTAIDNFLSKIRYANYQATFDLQRGLIKGLAGIKYSLECYRNAIQATTYMVKHCKNGDGQFDELWSQTTTNFRLNFASCRGQSGITYITKSKMEAAVKAQSKTANFNPDCIMNSKDIRYLVCARKYRGFSASDIAKEFKLTIKQAEIIMPKCPPEPLTPHKMATICRLHKDGVEIFDIVQATKVKFVDAFQVLNSHCAHTQGLFS